MNSLVVERALQVALPPNRFMVCGLLLSSVNCLCKIFLALPESIGIFIHMVPPYELASHPGHVPAHPVGQPFYEPHPCPRHTS